MISTEFNWKTTSGLNIYAKEWSPESPKAVLCLVHGLGEHVNRYEHLASFFASQGFVTIGNDHHGHGQSGGKRGHAPSYEHFMEEVDQLIIEAQKKHPKLPVFLYGHSMGGNFVMNYVLKRNPAVKGLIATGPAIQVPKEAQPSSVLLAFAKIMNTIFPSLQQPNGLDAKHISKDLTVVTNYQDDPLVHDKISIRTALSLLEKAAFLDKYEGTMQLPLLLMHGAEDHITAPEGSVAFAKRVKGDITLKVWDEMYHEIHNEPNQSEVFNFALDWLHKRIG